MPALYVIGQLSETATHTETGARLALEAGDTGSHGVYKRIRRGEDEEDPVSLELHIRLAGYPRQGSQRHIGELPGILLSIPGDHRNEYPRPLRSQQERVPVSTPACRSLRRNTIHYRRLKVGPQEELPQNVAIGLGPPRAQVAGDLRQGHGNRPLVTEVLLRVEHLLGGNRRIAEGQIDGTQLARLQ